MERQVMKLRADLETSNRELSETNLQLSQLRKRAYTVLSFPRRDTILFNGFVFRVRVMLLVSEAMYKEYDQLKQQYELETGTLQKAMERASQVNN